MVRRQVGGNPGDVFGSRRPGERCRVRSGGREYADVLAAGDRAGQAGELCGVLRPKVAIPTHYAFTAGPVRDRLLLKYDGTPQRLQHAAAQHAPETQVKILPPGEPLTL